MNYRESLLTYETPSGETHMVSAFKVKYVRGTIAQTEITAEPTDGRVVVFTVARPVTEVRDEILQALTAGE